MPAVVPPTPMCCCCPGSEDRDIWQYFATASMPSEEKAAAVLTALAEAGTAVSTVALEARVDLRRTPLELLLKVLAVDGAVERVGGGWRSTGTALDIRRRAVQPDRRGPGGRAGFHGHLPGHRRMPDGVHHLGPRRRDRARLRPLRQLRRSMVPGRHCRSASRSRRPDAEPRRDRRWNRRLQWPSGMDRLGVGVKGKIKPEESVADGRALARLTDLGWGGALRETFAAGAPDRTVDPGMLQACVQVLRNGVLGTDALRDGAAPDGPRRSSASRPAPSRHWSTRWPAASLRSAASRTLANCSSNTAALRAGGAATARTAWPAFGTGWSWVPTWKRPSAGCKVRA